MSGIITWDKDSEYIHHYNQPPLYFYLIAFVGHFFGYGEVQLHLFQSFFTALAIFCFYSLSKFFVSSNKALLLTFLFTYNPAFLVNQNLMVDVPLLSLHLLFFLILFSQGFSRDVIRYLLAALVLSMALMIKYTSLPLLVILVIAPILKGQAKYAWSVLLPIFILLGWSYLNYLEFGDIHILMRRTHAFSITHLIRSALDYTWTFGSIATFALVFLPKIRRSYLKSKFIVSIVLFLGLVAIYALATFEFQKIVRWGLWMLFGALGLLVLIFVIRKAVEFVKEYLSHNVLQRDKMILMLWFASLAAFIILFAPFMATRHVLLCLPPLLIISAQYVRQPKRVTCFLIAFIGLSLGLSDLIYAKAFQQQAFAIKRELPRASKVWSVGSWGWQWYSKKAGMLQLNSCAEPDLKTGDYLIIPSNVARHNYEPKFEIAEVRKIVVPGNIATYFYTANYASMYAASFDKNTWTLSDSPIASFTIYRVQSK